MSLENLFHVRPTLGRRDKVLTCEVPGDEAHLVINSSLTGQSVLQMEGRKRSTLGGKKKKKALFERDGFLFFFCSPYPLSAMETGTEAVLSVASEIGSRAIVFAVAPAALPASAC